MLHSGIEEKSSSFSVLIFITDVCQSEISIIKICNAALAYLSRFILSQSTTFLRMAGQNHWLFPDPFFVSTGSSRRTETVCGCSYKIYRTPAPQPHWEFTCNCFTMNMMPHLIWSRQSHRNHSPVTFVDFWSGLWTVLPARRCQGVKF